MSGFTLGERVGVPWLGATCGVCPYCRAGRENLCDAPVFTGYTRDGGFATHTVADARYCFPLGEQGDDAEIAPWLCAGLIGWRSYRMAGEGKALGIYGFGAAAHILAQVAQWQGRQVYRLHPQGRHGGAGFRPLARRGLGRRFRGDAARAARRRHHLRAGRRAGAGGAARGEEGRPRGLRRHPHVGYPELSLCAAVGGAAGMSVANLTREDAREFLEVAPQAGVQCEVTRYPLERANEALSDLRDGRLQGAAVLIP